mmetsp:Transcript_21267/g.48866  ORF Transcript_21267/g.48866 Transcript_21267/m.48866 type:complete len:341 (-) Transcript_21267:255-1277(-)
MSLSRLGRIVESGTNACYGIEWALSKDGVLLVEEHFNPTWRIEYAHKVGMEGLYTTKSVDFTFKIGEGLVGKVFEEQQVTFVKDLQKLTTKQVRDAMFEGKEFIFKRTALARDFDLHSAVFVPTSSGVIEVGSMQELPDLSTLLPLGVIKAIREEAPIPAVGSVSVPEPERCSQSLKRIVEDNVNICYVIHWGLAEDGVLECKEHYNPPWRIAYAQKAGLHGLYTTRSAAFRIHPDEDVVGEVYCEGEDFFLPNMQTVAFEDLKCGLRRSKTGSNNIAMARFVLAKEFDIHAVLWVSLKHGVLELGSMQEFGAANEMCSADSVRGFREVLPELPRLAGER